MKTKWQVLCLALFLIICFGIIGTMEYRLELQEEAWAESRQAVEAEQEKIQQDILEIREQLDRADEQIYAHNLLIWEMRDRVHLDLETELEE